MGNAKRDPERECYPLVSSGVSRGVGGSVLYPPCCAQAVTLCGPALLTQACGVVHFSESPD